MPHRLELLVNFDELGSSLAQRTLQRILAAHIDKLEVVTQTVQPYSNL